VKEFYFETLKFSVTILVNPERKIKQDWEEICYDVINNVTPIIMIRVMCLENYCYLSIVLSSLPKHNMSETGCAFAIVNNVGKIPTRLGML
jgi:hypothetical protein